MKRTANIPKSWIVFFPIFFAISFDCAESGYQQTNKMDILPSGNIFRELQDIYDTGYFSSQVSIEDQWQQASEIKIQIRFRVCGGWSALAVDDVRSKEYVKHV